MKSAVFSVMTNSVLSRAAAPRIAAALLLANAALFCGCDRIERGIAAFSGASERANAQETEETETETPQVAVYVVKNERVPLIHETPGRVVASKVAQVRPKVGGVLLKRLFEEGSFVREGDVLYEIESDVYKANYDKAEANLEELKRRQAQEKPERHNCRKRTKLNPEVPLALRRREQSSHGKSNALRKRRMLFLVVHSIIPYTN